MARLIIETQDPVVELPIKSKDGSGKTKKFIAGFKRYTVDEIEDKTKEYQSIIENSDFATDMPELVEFIKNEILYLKDVKISIKDEETGKVKTLHIKDTRTQKSLDTLWDSSEECLAVLLDSFFQWASWRVSFISAVQTAIMDISFDEDERKN